MRNHVIKRTERAIINELRIYNLIPYDYGISRMELVRLLKIPRSTVYDGLVRLELKNKVKRYDLPIGQRGRPMILWKRTINEVLPHEF